VPLGADLGVIDRYDRAARFQMLVGAVVVAVLDDHCGDAGALETLGEGSRRFWVRVQPATS
jgi:hypothetical protein